MEVRWKVVPGMIWGLAVGSWLAGFSAPVFADDFSRDIAPLLGKNCVACHNAKTPEGGLNMESFTSLMAGGDSGAAVVVGDPDSSELIARIRATDDSVMPPVDNSVGAKQLTADEIQQLVAWIRTGATPPSEESRHSIQWRSISEAVHPIYALQTSSDGQHLSFAKGNVAYLVDDPFAEGDWQPTPLLDDSLKLPDGTSLAATDKDLVHSLAFSHDSQKLAVGGYRTVKLWERKTSARSLEQPADHDSRIIESIDQLVLAEPITEAIAVVATVSEKLWVVTKSGQVLRLHKADGQWRQELAFSMEQPVKIASISPDARWLMAVDPQNSATLWRLEDGQKQHTLGVDYERWQAQQQTQRQIARQEGWIKRLSEMMPGLEEAIKKEEEARAKVAATHQQAIEAQQSKEQEIATAQQAATETEQSIAALEQQLAEMRQQLVDRQKAVADLQPALATAQQNVAKAMQALVSADAGLQLAREKIPVQQERIETHRQTLTQQQQLLEQVSNASRGETLAAGFDARSRQVLLVTATGQGLLYNALSGQPVAVLQSPSETVTGDTSGDAAGDVSEMKLGTADLLVSAEQVATIRTDQKSWQWDLNLPWELVQSWGDENSELFSSRVTALAFSPDDRFLAVGSGPPSRFGDMKELVVATGEVHRDYGQVHSDTILAIDYSPDGKWLATAGADKLCRLHDPLTGAMVKILEGHTHFVQSLAWQEQAQQLATASADKTVKTWDVETGERRQSITGFGKEISAIAYVGDSEQLVSVSLDGHTRLHRGDNAQLVQSYAHNPQPLYTLSLSSDGKRVLIGDHDGKIRVYQIEDAQLLRQWPE
jgi:WD40 repeat protein